jgi:hypothetical protein
VILLFNRCQLHYINRCSSPTWIEKNRNQPAALLSPETSDQQLLLLNVGVPAHPFRKTTWKPSP